MTNYEKLGSNEQGKDSSNNRDEAFEPFNPKRAQALQEKAREARRLEEQAKEQAREEVRKNRGLDTTLEQLENAEYDAEYHQRKLAENYESAARIETGDPVPIKVESFRFGKVFVPETPALDDFIAGEGSLSRPIELMPMMEESSKHDGSFKLLNNIDKQLNRGKKLSRDAVVSLGVQYLAYQEQRQHIRNRREQDAYDNALFSLENRIAIGLSGLGEGTKLKPDSEIGVEISRSFERLKLDALQKASPRRQKKFLEDAAGKKDVSAAERFSKDFNPQDLTDELHSDDPDLSDGGVWEQNHTSLKLRRNEEAYHREALQRLGVK